MNPVPYVVGMAGVLVNSLWQGALIAVAVVVILRCLPSANASTRYAIWWSALVAALLVPIVTTLPLLYSGVPQVPVVAHQSVVTAHRPHARVLPASASGVTQPAAAMSGADAPGGGASTLPPASHRARITVPLFVAGGITVSWALLALAILVRLGLALNALESLKRDALPLPVNVRDDMAQWRNAVKGGRDVRLCVSAETEVPVAVGLFDAMILIPKHLLETLGHAELDQISLHELAHLRRADDWTNGFQRIVSSLLFFNPAIRYIGQQLDVEREVACDDWVVNQTGAVRPYAMCLTRMAETTSWPHRAVPAPGVFVTRKNISIRIERLLRVGRDIGTGISPAPATIAAASIIALGFVAWGVSPSFAFDATSSAGTAVAGASPAHRVRLAHVVSPLAPRVLATLPAPVAPTKRALVGVVEKTIPPSMRPKTTSAMATGAAPAAITAAAARSPESARIESAGAANARVASPAANARVASPAASARVASSAASSRVAGVPGISATAGVLVASAAAGSASVASAAAAGTRVAKAAAVSAYVASADTASAAAAPRSRAAGSSSSGDVQGCTGCDFDGADLSSKDLRGHRYAGSNFANVNFSRSDLSGASLAGSNFEGANFRNTNLRHADLSGANMEGADFTGADLTGARLTGIHFEDVTFGASQARAIVAACKGCEFGALDLRGADFSGLHLEGLIFQGTNLSGASFANSRLSGISFDGCDLSGINVRGAHLNGVEFPKSKLGHIDWSAAYLTAVQLNEP